MCSLALGDLCKELSSGDTGNSTLNGVSFLDADERDNLVQSDLQRLVLADCFVDVALSIIKNSSGAIEESSCCTADIAEGSGTDGPDQSLLGVTVTKHGSDE